MRGTSLRSEHFFPEYGISRESEPVAHGIKKTLGLRFVKDIQTFASVIGPHSVVVLGTFMKIKIGSTVSHGLPLYSL